MFIVGFTGRAGVGKDTAGSVLINSLGFTRFAFADPIKRAISAMFGWDQSLWNDREWKETNLPGRGYSPRSLAQTLGTEWGRQLVDKNLWLHATESLIRESGVDRVVITDVRFDNEARWIMQRGGVVIELLRPDAPAAQAHASELGVHGSLIDFTLLNHGSQEAFEAQIYSEIHAKLIAVGAV